MSSLYHFTCAHARRDIGTGPRCLLVPHPHPLLGCKVLWLTSLDAPDPDEVGLTQSFIRCDRREFRYEVLDLAHCRTWYDSAERDAAPGDVRRALELYGRPDTWWISDVPVVARFDRTWTRAA